MNTKSISSTVAQNNFGQVMDDVVLNKTRYIIKRRNTPQAIILSLADFQALLCANEVERKDVGEIIQEVSPEYCLGSTITKGGQK